MKSGVVAIAWLLLGCVTLPAIAGVQSLDAVRAAAEAQLRDVAPEGTRMVVHAESLDSRLRLPACDGPLKASLPGDGRIRGSRVSVVVACSGTQGWRVRVPTAVQMFRNVLVTTRPLARDDSISQTDVRLQERDVARLAYGYVVDIADIAGRAVVRPLREGTVLTPSMLAHRQLVHRGDGVSLMASLQGIQVRAEGVALEGGDRGEHVRVRNTSSGRIIDAQVSGPGLVEALP